MRVTVGNLKGGAGKTTTAVFLACGLARYGRTALVDADEQQSALRWSEAAGEGFTPAVFAWATRDLARRVGAIAGDYEHVVIDTAPAGGAVLRQALLATGRLVIPVAPSAIELQRLHATLELAEEVDAITPVDVSVLLAKVRTGTRSAGLARQLLADSKLPVLATAVPLREAYATAWGTVPLLADYEHVLDELAGADLVEDALRRST